MLNTPIPAAAEGLPTLNVNREALQRMRMCELHNLYKAIYVVRETMLAFTCQPRFSSKNNIAGEALEEYVDHLNEYVDTIISVAELSEPSDPNEVEHRGFLLVEYEIGLRETLSSVCARAAQMADEKASADFQAAHGRKPE